MKNRSCEGHGDFLMSIYFVNVDKGGTMDKGALQETERHFLPLWAHPHLEQKHGNEKVGVG